MNEVNKRRAAALGMPTATANSQLRKILLFAALQRLGEDLCYRCGNRIETIEELSVEHKKSWLLSDNPKEMFFDLNNISFSHLLCNTRAAPKVDSSGNGWGKGKPNPRKGLSIGQSTIAPEGKNWCSGHQAFLDIGRFHVDNSTGTGYKNICISCRSEYRKIRYRNNLSR